MARENARMVRDQLSEEIWVELNNLYLYLNSPTLPEKFSNDPQSFFRRTIRFSLVFQGLTDATIHHDEGWRFMSLGKYLERSDQTSRVLDTLTMLGEEPTRLDLIGALRSCSALSAYRRVVIRELFLYKMWLISFYFREIFLGHLGLPLLELIGSCMRFLECRLVTIRMRQRD